jgi:hypothetical protein
MRRHGAGRWARGAHAWCTHGHKVEQVTGIDEATLGSIFEHFRSISGPMCLEQSCCSLTIRQHLLRALGNWSYELVVNQALN